MSKYRSGYGRLRLKELWQREAEDGHVKVVMKHRTKEELRLQVLDYSDEHSLSNFKEISSALRLDVMENVRLTTVLDELETERIVTKRTENNEIMYEFRRSKQTK